MPASLCAQCKAVPINRLSLGGVLAVLPQGPCRVRDGWPAVFRTLRPDVSRPRGGFEGTIVVRLKTVSEDWALSYTVYQFGTLFQHLPSDLC